MNGKLNKGGEKKPQFPWLAFGLVLAVILLFVLGVFLLSVSSAGASSGNPPLIPAQNVSYGIGGGDCSANRAEWDLYHNVEKFCPPSGEGAFQEIATEVGATPTDEVPTDIPTEKPTEETPEPTVVIPTTIVVTTPPPPTVVLTTETPATEVPTERPTEIVTELPTETSQPPVVEETSTPKPEKTKKPPCNNGEGNGGENCSPSDNGNNDEDDEKPGGGRNH